MKLLISILILIYCGHARGQDSPGQLTAYWLSDTKPETADSYNPLLLLTRLPLDRLVQSDADSRVAQLAKFDVKLSYILDRPAIFLETYERDSIWNADRMPIKAFKNVTTYDSESQTIVASGRRYECESAKISNVIHLLQNPEGTEPLHRLHSPFRGAQHTALALTLLLKNQLEHFPEKAEPSDACADWQGLID
jgi:hypothetical protein